jgi:glyoxylase-like metal-dependent hydrolase (beta-lactamase superfamily II)
MRGITQETTMDVWKSWAARAFTLAAVVGLLASCASRDSAQAVVQDSERAMGGAALKSVSYTASGTGWGFGQAWRPGMPWPRANVVSYTRVLDYANTAQREEQVRSRAEPNGGTGLPLSGEQRSVGLWRDGVAWNLAGANATWSGVAASGRGHDFWTSPHGVLKAALRNASTVTMDGPRRVVSFTQPGQFKASIWIDANGLVERVDSIQPSPVLGDVLTVTQYDAYKDFGGVKFPTRIRQTMGGHPVLDVAVTDVQVNAAAAIDVPDAVRSGRETVTSERAAPGVWFLAGGSHNSVLIEMADHVILVESPLYDGRALAVLDEVRRLIPNKPVRYVVNSHHHFDHSGGLRTAASTGATLVVGESARLWWQDVLKNPNTIAPDALASAGGRFTLMPVDGTRTLSDGTRTVQVHEIRDSGHAHGFLMVWLPAERLLIEADAYTPLPPNTPPPAVPNANNLNLVLNVAQLQLNPDRILPLHGRMVPASELYTTAGKRP